MDYRHSNYVDLKKIKIEDIIGADVDPGNLKKNTRRTKEDTISKENTTTTVVNVKDQVHQTK